MTKETDLLPMPKGDAVGMYRAWSYDQMQAYALANITHAVAPLQAEIERLQAEVAEWKRVAAAQAELHGEAEARADKLAAVLRLALDSHGVLLMTDPLQDAWKVHRVEEIGRALLRDQEEDREQ